LELSISNRYPMALFFTFLLSNIDSSLLFFFQISICLNNRWLFHYLFPILRLELSTVIDVGTLYFSFIEYRSVSTFSLSISKPGLRLGLELVGLCLNTFSDFGQTFFRSSVLETPQKRTRKKFGLFMLVFPNAAFELCTIWVISAASLGDGGVDGRLRV